MAEFFFNDGKEMTIRVKKDFEENMLLLSAEVKVGDESIKIAGHSVINFDGNLSIEDVQFEDHKLDLGKNCVDKNLAVIIDVSKFKVVNKKIKEVDLKVTCSLKIFAGSKLIKECEIDDSENPEPNSVFDYLLTFKLES